METQLSVLLGTAAMIGFVHTVLGPDHYIPFVAMAKAGEWSRTRTLLVTIVCGIGHVMGSVVLGLLGVWLGWKLGSIEAFEGGRGNWAAWALIAFGLVYGIWGLRRGIRNRPHTHRHMHADGIEHDHTHSHQSDHAHAHAAGSRRNLTPWVLFVVFILGPCEALIPVLMVPAAAHSWWGLFLVTAVFGVVTVVTMTGITVALLYGLRLLPLGKLERWSHALAGLALFVSGGAIQFLGL